MNEGGARALALALVTAASPLGCDDGAVAPPAAEVSAVAPPAASAPRRPARRYYVARTSERCEIFAQDGEERSEPFYTPCPEYMLIGERIRVVGKTCTLENKAQPEREKPVVCPDPLTRFEKEERARDQAREQAQEPPPR